MRPIGAIIRLQAQRASLKVGQRPWQRYDPAPLLPAVALTIAEGGATGHLESGEVVMDVHHRDHPASKNRHGHNAISVGFTSHYAAMRARLGERLTDGLAGENLLVASDGFISEDDLRGGLLIETAGGWVRLSGARVAEPCAPFSRYLLGRPAAGRALSETLAFLRGGMRGYYVVYHGPPVMLHTGDLVFMADQD